VALARIATHPSAGWHETGRHPFTLTSTKKDLARRGEERKYNTCVWIYSTWAYSRVMPRRAAMRVSKDGQEEPLLGIVVEKF
jgi:hypothetical protein